jgi:hypothetical protein
VRHEVLRDTSEPLHTDGIETTEFHEIEDG